MRHIEWETERMKDRENERKKDRYNERTKYRHIDITSDRHIKRQTYIHRDRQTDRQTDNCVLSLVPQMCLRSYLLCKYLRINVYNCIKNIILKNVKTWCWSFHKFLTFFWNKMNTRRKQYFLGKVVPLK